MKKIYLIQIVAIILIIVLCVCFVQAEVIQTKLTIDNTIYAIDNECLRSVCSEIINGTLYVTW